MSDYVAYSTIPHPSLFKVLDLRRALAHDAQEEKRGDLIFFIPGLTTKQDLELGELGGVEPYLMNFSTLNSQLPESEIMRSDKAYGCRGQERGRVLVVLRAAFLCLVCLSSGLGVLQESHHD